MWTVFREAMRGFDGEREVIFWVRKARSWVLRWVLPLEG